MRTILQIGIPYIIYESENTKLCADVEIIKDGVCIRTKETLWYKTNLEYGKYLCVERMDSFLVNLLLYAMEHDYDIVCEGKTTEDLYYQLTEYLIPLVSKNERYNSIRIYSPLDNERLPCCGAVGTGISGGVDSFYTILKHINRKEESHNITHLFMANCGTNGDFGGENARNLFNERRNALFPVVKDLGLELVCLDTNINEFILQNHNATALTRLYANVLALQKLFRLYYVGSTYAAEDFNVVEEEDAHWDLLNIHCFSTSNCVFHCSGMETTRCGKLGFISNFDIARNHLDVCIGENAGNCGNCLKCMRTMTGLYAMDSLKMFNRVFDIDAFYKNKNKYLRFVVCEKNSTDMSEIYEMLKRNHKLPVILQIYGTMYRVARIIYRKTLRRWVRKM